MAGNNPNDGKTCGAKTRSGVPCKRAPAKGKKRCRLHGGAEGVGAPKGSCNALKHGLYSDALTPKETELWTRIEVGSLDDEIRLAKLRLRRLQILQNEVEVEAGDQDITPRSPQQQLGALQVEEQITTQSLGPGGEGKQTQLVRKRRDYQPEIRQLLRTIGELEQRRTQLGGGGQADPAQIARDIAASIGDMDALMSGTYEPPAAGQEHAP